MSRALATELLDRAMAAGATVTTAESCTGGMVAAAITDVAGSSNIFDRGFVTYSNDAKRDLLGVSASTLDTCGAVSEPVVKQMAIGALNAAGASVAVAISGIAGPGGSEHKPEGRVCFAIATADTVKSETVEFGARGRAQVRDAATEHALALLLRALGEL
ncbi:CinA family protein [Marivita hallyeonensis]|uniref:Nicotinamide-nucleotide amidase n=1 Tax=Marivita hallyeonensis TaxID=996342 RepID=A0A1M5R6G1_9RHOB|nr:CinA family protein [Marivita hallyeonensis]SHH21433.1 nicotinamide-nucleotide amidase [Marivita hallyeonensis]